MRAFFLDGVFQDAFWLSGAFPPGGMWKETEGQIQSFCSISSIL